MEFPYVARVGRRALAIAATQAQSATVLDDRADREQRRGAPLARRALNCCFFSGATARL